MTVEIGFLGPWQTKVDGQPVQLAGRRRVAVLARLALDAGRPVSSHQLIADVWGQSAAATAGKQLHIVVSKLRELLPPGLIATVPGGYLLDLHRDQVDAHSFTLLAGQARMARDRRDPGAADGLFRRALALWRGRALDELADPWAQIESRRLEQERLAVFEDHMELRLAAGEHDAVLAGLTRHVQAHPFREGPRAQLMLALYRAARPSDALAVYQQGRAVMVEELGLEPGARLRRLQHAILTRDPALELGTPAQAATIVPAELPADTRSFTARHEEVEWLREALRHEGAAVVDGPGGVGKSALAVHVAHATAGRFRDGVIYVNLNGATPGVQPLPVPDALGHLLRSLGLDGSAVPTGLDEAVARYRSLTAASDLLVILDNALDADQVRPLIPAGPGCRTVITSRYALSTLDDARHLHLARLGDRDAVTLLARIAGPDRVQREPESAAEITGLCGGFPLAIRVAGARLRARPDWRLADLADRLADATRRLDTLQYDDLAVRASIAVSHRHLREEPSGHDAARALPLLGLLDTPTHTPAATAALAGWPESRAEAALERLRGARLLESVGRGRYRFHDLIRLYAREQADRELPERDRAAALRHGLHHYLATVNTATQLVHPQVMEPYYGAEQPGVPLADAREAREWTEAERDNLLAVAHQAAESADPHTAIGLALGLHMPFNFRGWVTHLTDVHLKAIELAERHGDRAGQAQAENYLGWVYRDQGRHEQAIQHLKRAVTCWEAAGLPHRRMGSYNNLGINYTVLGRLDLADANLSRALEIVEEVGDGYARGAVLNNRVHVLFRQDRFEEAIAQARAAVAQWSGTLYGEGVSRESLARALMHAGRLTEAADAYAVALALLREAGYRIGYAVAAWWSGQTLHALGRHAEARRDWHACFTTLLETHLLTRAEADKLMEQPVPEMPGPIRHML
ncbi:AfsR/SARP family transcriptional regulator [Nonomuraea gerenzanensis]|uniref:Putative regulatory protein n=1 Tax=Nonomuraea gerenzanensis TaxID=93944 RepID=A0A1M4EQR2_9ACTN|nr:BTAD domain-containing putative transcriptional regulator [Nonomuraea gerenzanensis]UBU12615.1 tetratricopeptide repeat protein [Nonomuraea gerenzanensis]SBP01170.1 putative regulatory protein [Nonomuraea gerenzanensis]